MSIAAAALPAAEALEWAGLPGCGAVVAFTGLVHDHAEGRSGVTALEYEAYPELAEARLRNVAAELRRRWPEAGRVVLLHRIGRLGIGEPAVVVVVSTPHRGAAFDAAEWAIDTVKATLPIWKKETWAGGTDWGTGAQDLLDVPGASPALPDSSAQEVTA